MGVRIALILTLRIPLALTARIPIAHTARLVRPLLTAVMIIRPLALKKAGHGMVLIASTVRRLLLTAAPQFIAAPVTAVTTLQLRALKPEELGTEAPVRCRTQAVPAAPPRIPPRLAGFFKE